MRLLYSLKVLLNDLGSCSNVEYLRPIDLDDFINFFQWDNTIEAAMKECAKDKKDKVVEFKRLGKDYTLNVKFLDDNILSLFKLDIYAKS